MDELRLISFGNYLLARYDVHYPDGNKEQAQVTYADLANWKTAIQDHIADIRSQVTSKSEP